MIALSCASCQKKLSVKDELAGKKVKRPTCGTVILVQASVKSPAMVAADRPGMQTSSYILARSPILTANEVTRAPSGEVTSHEEFKPLDRGVVVIDFLAPATDPDEMGRLGPYRVLKVLGAGGMGVVFKAEDPGLQRLVALKAMLPSLASTPDAKERFVREARAIAALKHPHIVSIYYVGEDRGVPFLAMEFLEGEPLDVRLKREGKLPVAVILRIGEEIASGLAVIHEHGLVHRDIKPANIWLESTPGEPVGSASGARVKILDFGLARAAKDDTQITQPGTILGTPAYMSPEQARGNSPDHRSDLFSLGSVLYCLCTNRVPFDGTTHMAQLAALIADQPEPVRDLNPDIPEALDHLIRKLLEKNPEDRPQSAALVVKLLQQSKVREDNFQSTVKLAANDKPNRRRAQKPKKQERTFWRQRQTMLVMGAVTAFTVLAGIVILILLLSSSQDPQGEPRARNGSGQETFLADLKPAASVNWPFAKLKVLKGKKPPELFHKVVVKGVASPHGIFMHAAPPYEESASITYKLDKHYATFSAETSVNDTSLGAGSPMTFCVYGDGKLRWKSRPILFQKDAERCIVPVQDVTLLKLEVTASGDVGGAHAVWVEPLLVK